MKHLHQSTDIDDTDVDSYYHTKKEAMNSTDLECSGTQASMEVEGVDDATANYLPPTGLHKTETFIICTHVYGS